MKGSHESTVEIAGAQENFHSDAALWPVRFTLQHHERLAAEERLSWKRLSFQRPQPPQPVGDCPSPWLLHDRKPHAEPNGMGGGTE